MSIHCVTSQIGGWQQHRSVLGVLLAVWLAVSSFVFLAAPAAAVGTDTVESFASGVMKLDLRGLQDLEGLGRTHPYTQLESAPVGAAPVRLTRKSENEPGISASKTITYFTFFPVVGKALVCEPIPGASYGSVIPYPAVTDPPAANNPDLNLSMHGYVATNAYKGLVDYSGGSDSLAPQLYSLFTNNRTATFRTVYQVYDWDWGCNCRGLPITYWDVTLAGLETTPGETILTPGSGYDIGLMTTGYEAMVLYATPTQLTLKYTREDDVVHGYTIHLENVCVDPNLLAAYNYWNSVGRVRLPALYQGQALGRAIANEIGVVIRDSGMYMDPRSRKDWWQGR